MKMKVKETLGILFALATTLLFLSSISAFSFSQEVSVSKIQPLLLEKASKENSLQVIVKSDDALLNNPNFNLKRKINDNYFVGNILSTDLNEFASSNQVEYVWYDEKYNLLLDETVPLINATKFHDSGINGTGQTVCVIDSGVDYTHPDLGGCTNQQYLNGQCAKVPAGWDYVDDDNDPFEAYGSIGTHGNLVSIVAVGTGPSGSSNSPGNVGGGSIGTIGGNGGNFGGSINSPTLFGGGAEIGGKDNPTLGNGGSLGEPKSGSNGGLNKGVAHDSKVVAVRACENNECLASDILSAVQFCTDKAETHKIRVISMSFGKNLHDTTCDQSTDPLVDLLKDVKTKDIVAVASTGNDGNSTHISHPACLSDVVAVAGSTKPIPDEKIILGGNRNSITDLVAPFVVTINNPDASKSFPTGTSISTPHVSGSVALIWQLLEENSKYATPDEIRQAMKVTGKQIFDPVSGLTFSRVSAFEAGHWILNNVGNHAPIILSFNPTQTTLNLSQGSQQIFSLVAKDKDPLDTFDVEWFIDTNLVEIDNCSAGSNCGASFTFDASTIGSFVIKAIVTDGSLTDEQTWQVNVEAVQNNPPTIDTFNPSGDVVINKNENQLFEITASDSDGNNLVAEWFIDTNLVETDNCSSSCSADYTFIGDTVGNFVVKVVVSDGLLTDEQTWNIEVKDTVNNQPPTIDTFNPLTDPTINEGNSQLFRITTSDPDNDNLDVEWFIDGLSKKQENCVGSCSSDYTFLSDFNSAGNYQIKVVVSDGEFSDEQIWILTVLNVPTADFSVERVWQQFPRGSTFANQNTLFGAKIDNKGQVAGTAKYKFDFGDGNSFISNPITLAPGKIATVYVWHSYSTLGNYDLKVIADSENTLDEDNELNNEKILRVNVL